MLGRDRCILFDWGDTLMRDDPAARGTMASWPVVEAVAHAEETLRALHPGWVIGLATNAEVSTEPEIRAALRRVKLDAWIDKVYSHRTVGARKPSAEFFRRILDDLALDAGRVVMVGDGFENDVMGAVRAGLWAVWFNPRSPEARIGQGYRTAGDLAELPTLLEQWGVGESEPDGKTDTVEGTAAPG